jgi:chemotaxis response regulator CheB
MTLHIGKNLAKQFSGKLDGLVSAQVQVPRNAQLLARRNVYVAPDNGHIVVVQPQENGYICHMRR